MQACSPIQQLIAGVAPHKVMSELKAWHKQSLVATACCDGCQHQNVQ
jgi:hypothetical protein